MANADFAAVLDKVRTGKMDANALEYLKSNTFASGHEARLQSLLLQGTPHIAPTNEEVVHVNAESVARFAANRRKSVVFDTIKVPVPLAVGIPVVCITNLSVGKRVCNGEFGVLEAILYVKPDDVHHRALPAMLLVRFPEARAGDAYLSYLHQNGLCRGPEYDAVRGLAPVVPVAFRRRAPYLPIQPNFCMTIHKAQGKSFDRLIVSLPSNDKTLGQLYVALATCNNSLSNQFPLNALSSRLTKPISLTRR